MQDRSSDVSFENASCDLTKRGSERIESQDLQTDLHRSKSLTDRGRRILDTISSGMSLSSFDALIFRLGLPQD